MYRARQTEHGAAVEVIGSSAIDLREIASMLEQGLAQVGLENPKVTVYRVDEIQRQNSGKLKRFVSLRI